MDVQVVKYVFTNPLTKKDFDVFANVPKIDVETQISEIFGEESYKPLKKKNKVIIDIGANIGMASLYLRNFADTVYALEPNPYTFRCLVENTKMYKNIIPCNVGVNTVTETMQMFAEKGKVAQSVLKEDRFTDTMTVWGIRIDDFFKHYDITHVDFMKVDIEGAEYMMFMDESFHNVSGKIDAIVGEAHITQTGMFPEIIRPILESYGYNVSFRDTPYHNYEKTINFDRTDSNYHKSFVLKMWTIFEAKKV